MLFDRERFAELKEKFNQAAFKIKVRGGKNTTNKAKLEKIEENLINRYNDLINYCKYNPPHSSVVIRDVKKDLNKIRERVIQRLNIIKSKNPANINSVGIFPSENSIGFPMEYSETSSLVF